MPANRSFTIKRDSSGGTFTLQIHEPSGVSAENLSLSTWGSSFILANLLHRFHVKLPNTVSLDDDNPMIIPVIELGSGTGLVGLSAAVIWQTSVLLTDLAPILPGLAENVALNKSSLSSDNNNSVHAALLDWSQPAQAGLHGGGRIFKAVQSKAKVILAADTVYSDHHPELLSHTIRTWLAPGEDARVILTYPLRIAYLDDVRELWERLERKGLVCIEDGSETGDEMWDEPAPFEWCVWTWK